MGSFAKRVGVLLLGIPTAACSPSSSSQGGASPGVGPSDGSVGPADAGAPLDGSGPGAAEGPLDGGACGTMLLGTDAGPAPLVTTPGPASDAVVLLPSDATIVDTFEPTRTFGPYIDTAGNMYVSAVFPIGDGGSLGTGVVKIQPDHTTAWTTVYDPQWIVSDGKVDPAGNTVISASLLSSSPLDTSMQAVTVKYAPNGTVAWSKQYQLGFTTFGFALALGADGSVVTLGSSNLPGGPADGGGILFLVKYAADGTQQWTRSYCFGGLPKSAAIDAAGNIYASLGGTAGSVAKFTADGAQVYRIAFAAPQDTGKLVLSPDEKSLYLFNDASAVGTSVGLRKLDPTTGAVVWAMTVGPSAAANDPSTGVNWSGILGNRDYMAVTADTIYVAGAYSNSYSSGTVPSDFVTFVAAYDPAGTQKWFQQLQLSNGDGGVLSPYFGGLNNQPYLGADPAGNAVVLDARYPLEDNKTFVWKMSSGGTYAAY